MASLVDEIALSRLAGFDMRIRAAGTIVRDKDTGLELTLTERQVIVQGRTLWVTARHAENIRKAVT